MSTDIKQRIRSIEALAQTEVGRNIGPLASAAAGGLLDAAESLAATPKPSVAIMTGAYVPWASPAGAETDGPPSAAILAAGLQAMGISARLVTDSWCLPVVHAAAQAMTPALVVDGCDDDRDIRDRLAHSYRRSEITHLIAVERLGPASDGRVHNFRGEDVTPYTAPLHDLMTGGSWKTIAVGDGGNEIGMGNVPQAIVSATIEEGERVHCVTRSDHLIVAGVSNWGALALLLGVALFRDFSIRDLIAEPGATVHQRVVDACVDAGAVDGTLGRVTPMVDGLDAARHETIIGQMWQIAEVAPGS